MEQNRRGFLQRSVGAIVSTVAYPLIKPAQASDGQSQPKIPRWRGFNLTELAGGERRQRYEEADFAWMAEWGFNFARLPCSYWAWSTKEHWMTISEAALQPLDRAIILGRRYGVHINLCLHRIPGYCVNNGAVEPDRLFDSPPDSMERALSAAAYHWKYLAKRYKDVSSDVLSFDLLNEPPFMTDQSRYVTIADRLIDAIRAVDPHRLIFADGADLGQTPVVGLANRSIVQSTRGYLPKAISHYTATWVPPNEFESLGQPTWPLIDTRGSTWDRQRLRVELIEKWQPLERLGVPIHVGEWGCFNKTPHDVCLAWMRDLLGLWKEAGWGWSMWNLRGTFGILDSGRSDVTYETFRGHRLDRAMLELLRSN
ncbi:MULTISPECIES: glycoside hydrolase family 5 protein [Bradyrhizobium]|uniref:Mannan endo-1,4-beta-mannosidase n=2 Tax=Bradyrhizobium TaxID=374 RepID=A0ABY0Q7F6_9BRAD|nr:MULTISPECIES: cellulase family glycosylhydrolase [Bradyrhizobium]SDJ64628.1 Mannan endo-1,4-beta-mannosidase [Bradyrhizobium ottawaense]SEC31863.1 Mannan endo-1,4-beta-mannosidase [Bradyrhizobium lablabi]